MRLRELQNGIIIYETGGFSPEQTFECGQCFRFDQGVDGFYSGVALGRHITVGEAEGGVHLSCTQEEFFSVWLDYFDLSRDYSEARRLVAGDPFLEAAADYGAGIRILRQEPWEAFCSFIISQCNNIPRIKGIISRMCGLFGEPFSSGGATYYAFPSADRIASLETADLAPLRCGYRADYIIEAARAVSGGGLDLSSLPSLPAGEARRALTSVKGVGTKVADCTMLFGLGRLDAFPVDVWIRRALVRFYGGDLPLERFGKYAGIIQQYIFYYMREKAGDVASETACARNL